jgi:DNA-binding GntR family transcriptional regulator
MMLDMNMKQDKNKLEDETKAEDSAKKKGKTVEEVHDEIKKMIYYNMLAPGQKLIYRDIAERLNTSNTPVVQALKALERSNFVRHEPNKGYFVEEITKTEAKELFQAREALEIYAISLIIKNLDLKKLDAIKKAFRDYKGAMAPEHRRILMLKDAQFHLKIVECSGNTVIYRLLEHIFEQITLKYRPEYLWEDRIKEVAKEHAALLKSLREGDIKNTTNLLRSHIRKGKEHIVSSLQTYDLPGL